MDTARFHVCGQCTADCIDGNWKQPMWDQWWDMITDQWPVRAVYWHLMLMVLRAENVDQQIPISVQPSIIQRPEELNERRCRVPHSATVSLSVIAFKNRNSEECWWNLFGKKQRIWFREIQCKLYVLVIIQKCSPLQQRLLLTMECHCKYVFTKGWPMFRSRQFFLESY